MFIQCFDSTNSIRLFHFIVWVLVHAKISNLRTAEQNDLQKNRQPLELLSHICSQKLFIHPIAVLVTGREWLIRLPTACLSF